MKSKIDKFAQKRHGKFNVAALNSLGDQLALVLATGFGIGFIPVMSGTWGTLLAIPLYLACIKPYPFFFLVAFVIVTMLGVWASDIAGPILGQTDASQIVIDEVAGLSMCLVITQPVGKEGLVIAFFFFRIFDILKPFPISFLEERIPGGLGVMVDDIVAGLFAGITIVILSVVFHLSLFNLY